LLRLSVAKGEEFYGHLRETFRKRMLAALTKDIHKALDDAFPFTVPPESSEAAAEKMIGAKADHEVDKIVEFMTGRNPGALEDGEDPEAPGTVKCLALLYRGEGAIEKIRNRLGKTNPEQAEDGSIRGHFGTNIMHNAAHASDEPANAERERKIVGLWEEEKPCDVKQIIDGYLASL
jgi:hypothetical protein